MYSISAADSYWQTSEQPFFRANSVQFSSRWCICARKSSYALGPLPHPSLSSFPKYANSVKNTLRSWCRPEHSTWKGWSTEWHVPQQQSPTVSLVQLHLHVQHTRTTSLFWLQTHSITTITCKVSWVHTASSICFCARASWNCSFLKCPFIGL